MSSSSRKWLVMLLLGILAGALALLAWNRFHKRPLTVGIPIAGGAAMNTRIAAPLYKQWNPAWSKQTLGDTDSPMGSTGCTVCSMAMALSSKGFPVDPSALNAQLSKAKAFTPFGLLIWSGVGAVTKGGVKVRLDDTPTHRVIDAELAAGNSVLAKVLYHDRIWHWVLITGKAGADYLIHDPLSSGPEYEPMTAYPRGIFAIRYLEKS
jgi:hypothetical protein